MTHYAQLRLAPDGPVAFEVSDVKGSMWVPSGSRFQGAVLQAQSGGITVRGIERAADVRLHANKSALLAGYVLLTRKSMLGWLEARKGHVKVELVPHWDDVSYLTPARGEVSCDGLSLDEQDFDPLADRGVPDRQHWGLLSSGDITLYDAPRGRPLATLHVTGGANSSVSVHGTRNGFARTLYDCSDALLLGWVEAKQVTKVSNPSRLGRSWGKRRASRRGGFTTRTLRCQQRIQLAARFFDQNVVPREATVGWVDPGVTIRQRLPPGDPLSTVVLPTADWLSVDYDAQLLAKTVALAGCAEVSD